MHTHAPFVLALEPDLRQASVLKRVIRDRVHAELMVVDSRDAAIAATAARIPDVILLTALLSPRDEAELIAHLRGLAGAEHVQTHTIPQLASSSHDGDGGQEQGGLFGKLRRRKAADQAIPGCDPTAFADEVGTFIQRAAEMKAHAALMPPPPIIDRVRPSGAQEHESAGGQAAETASEETAGVESAWSSPFEWRRPDPAAQKTGHKKEPAPPRPPLVKNAPLAVVAEEEEARRAQADRRTQNEAAQERQRLEAEAAAQRERERVEAEAAAQRERERREAEAAAKREQERLEAEAAAKRERERLEAEAAAKRERERLEAEAAAKRERERLEAEAAAKRERERLEAEAAAKRERERLEAEAAAKRERERREAEAAAKRERERREAEAAAKRERERREAEAAAKRERERLEAEAAAKRERERLEAEAAAKRERERLEAEAAAAAERERLRLEAEAAEQERLRTEAQARAAEEADEDVELEINLDHDPFADFRSDGEQQPGALLNLMPVTAWARLGDGKRQESQPPRTDDVQALMAGLSIPPHVAAVAYARGCRIRRVRVPAPRPAARSRLTRPLILSKRALAEVRNDQQSGA